MGNRADDEGTDVTIYLKPLTDTVHADTPTGAPEPLLALLDNLGFERRTLPTPGPVYVWHEAPPPSRRGREEATRHPCGALAAQGRICGPHIR